jgi:peptidoglycan/LPS O-acetylase OafA/YrhL
MLKKLMTIDIPGDRVFGLDALRAVAIFLVVYAHGAYGLAVLFPKALVQLPLFDGVSIFFVLSGYLIGTILMKIFERGPVTGGIVWNFWLRRWLRTLPNYFLILIVLVIYQIQTGALDTAGLWRYFLFMQNFASVHPAFFPEAWSLSVEEWFYILLPLLLLVMVLLGLRVRLAFAYAIAVTIVASLVYRYGIVGELDFESSDMADLIEWDQHLRKQVLTRLDSLMYGVLGAYLHYYRKEWWLRHKLTLLFAGIALLLFHKYMSYSMDDSMSEYAVYFGVFSFSVISVGTLFLLPWLSQLHIKSGVFYEVVTRLSLISYSMYLVHFTLVRNILVPETLALFSGLGINQVVALSYVLYWLYTIVLSVLLYKFFELPMMNLRARLPMQRNNG